MRSRRPPLFRAKRPPAPKADLAAACRAAGLPEPVAEHRFHPTRKWRFDWAWPEHRLALEIEGGAWIGGRHTSGAGFVGDMEKYSEAAILGWRILRCQPKEARDGKALDLVRRALEPAREEVR